MAQARLEVEADVRGIAAHSGVPRRVTGRQPVPQPLPDRQQRLTRAARGRRGQLVQRCLRAVPVAEPAAAQPPAPLIAAGGQFHTQIPAAVPRFAAVRAPAAQPLPAARIPAPAPRVDTAL